LPLWIPTVGGVLPVKVDALRGVSVAETMKMNMMRMMKTIVKMRIGV